MSNPNFTCDKCNITFIKNRTDEKAKEEYDRSPWNIPGEGHGVICDDCFEAFKIWYDSLSPEDHARIRSGG